MRRVNRVVGILGTVIVVASLLAGSVAPAAAVELQGARVFVSSSSSGSVDGISFASGDIMAFDGQTNTWSKFFDASDAGLGNANVDGFDIEDSTPGSTVIRMSFTGVVTVPGIGLVDDSDVIVYTEATGAFDVLIDGSDVGLTSGGEDIDAFSIAEGFWALSTLGTGSVPAAGGGSLTAADEDVLSFTGTTGQTTNGAFETHLDSSDVGLTGDLVSVWIDQTTGEIFGSGLNGFNIGGFRGDGDDIFVFTGTTGQTSSGTFGLFFDGDLYRFGGEQIDGLHIEPGSPPPPGEADLDASISSDVDPAVVAGDTVTFSVTVTNDGPDPAVNVVVTDILPAGLIFVSTNGCGADPNGLPCSLGDLGPGAMAMFTVLASVDGDVLGTLTNTVEATSSTADPSLGNNTASTDILVSGPPAAVDDGPSTNSIPGNPFHTDIDTPFSLAAPGILANDELGSPSGAVVSFGGGDLNGSVTDTAAGETSGNSFLPVAVTVNADGSMELTSTGGFTGSFSFMYRLANEGGFSDALVTIQVGPRQTAMFGDLIYLSTASAGSVDGLAFEDEDILVYDTVDDSWRMFFDGSDVGLGTADIDGFAVVPDQDTLLLTLTAPRTIAGVGPTDDSDVLVFNGTSLGPDTAGAFELVIDGSDLALTSGGEDVDAFALGGEEEFEMGIAAILSTTGSYNVGGGVAGGDEDLLGLGFDQAGPSPFGPASLFFDGSDVGLAPEDVVGVSIDRSNGDLFLVNRGPFAIPELSGDGNDIIAFSGTTGPDTSGAFSRFFDGDAAGLTGQQIDGIDVVQQGCESFTSVGTELELNRAIGCFNQATSGSFQIGVSDTIVLTDDTRPIDNPTSATLDVSVGSLTDAIDGADIARILTVIDGDVTISGTLRRGTGAPCDGVITCGGAVYVGPNGSLTLESATVEDSEADRGGGVYSEGNLQIVESTISGNEAAEDGGGVWTSGSFTSSRTTIAGNVAGGSGGGVNTSGNTSVDNSTISGNHANEDGGGLYAEAGAAMTFATVTDNSTLGQQGGAVAAATSATGIEVASTIVAENPTGLDCALGGALVNLGHNLDSDGSCGLTGPSDNPAAVAGLGPLQNNGGPTETHALLPTSDAIDGGNASLCALPAIGLVDQREFPRADGLCDIGAFERQTIDIELSPISTDPPTTVPGGSVGHRVLVSASGTGRTETAILSATVPPGATFSAFLSGGWDCPDGSPAGTVCSQQVGVSGSSSINIPFGLNIDDPYQPLGLGVTTVFTVTAPEAVDPNLANNTLELFTPVEGAAPDVVLTKTDGGGVYGPGDTIVYTNTVSNTGNRIAPSVVLSEWVPANTVFNPSASTPGWTCSPASGVTFTNCTIQFPAIGAVPIVVDFAVDVVDPLPSGTTGTINLATVSHSSQFPEADRLNNCFEDATSLQVPGETLGQPPATDDDCLRIGNLDDPNLTVDEGQAIVIDLVAIGQGTKVFGLGGVDAGRFQINTTTGLLNFVEAPDYENPVDANGDNVYEVTVTLIDQGGPSADSVPITVTVNDVDEGP